MSADRDASDFSATSHLRKIDERHSVISGIQTAEDALARINDTFGERPDLVIVYQGVAKGLSQRQIAEELATRAQPGASQTSVARNVEKLEKLWFLKKPQKGPHVVRPAWDEEFNLSRELKRILRRHKVAPL